MSHQQPPAQLDGPISKHVRPCMRPDNFSLAVVFEKALKSSQVRPEEPRIWGRGEPLGRLHLLSDEIEMKVDQCVVAPGDIHQQQ